MKKYLFLLLTGLFLVSCSVNETLEVRFEFDGAVQNIMHYDEGTTTEQLKDYVANRTYGDEDKTRYFIFYPKTTDVSYYSSKPFSSKEFYSTVVESTPKPTHIFYKMPNDDKVYDDGLWLFEQAIK